MRNRKPYNDIPLEGLLKYIKADRDSFKAKLEQLIPYTKSLETRIGDLEKEIEVLRKEKSSLMREVTRTPIYKSLLDRYTKVRRDNQDLLERVAKYETDTFDLG